jgi:hypothetical protein
VDRRRTRCGRPGMDDAIDPRHGITHPDFKDAFALMNAEVHELVKSVQVRLTRHCRTSVRVWALPKIRTLTSPAPPACVRQLQFSDDTQEEVIDKTLQYVEQFRKYKNL